ncbi:simple sugar transport system permease protein [Kineococcus radiotolerans]|uniref:Simple sugar transport system permease protein n=1 Tax=Kineococcus radiotolerans TaxID=131568 RepID=A0A7W4TNP6_KINRA|nr:ABC transporter permease [Kineococcus radiotolerans]MBB2902286.1 simple sugar transport system permease protein [Kineococcus radiotolerans]
MSTETPAKEVPPAGPAGAAPRRPAPRRTWLVTVFAVVGAVLVGAVLIAVGDARTRAAAGYFFSYPWDTFSNAWYAVRDAYLALLEGALYSPDLSGRAALGPISETLVNATPLVLGGLAVALAFRVGLFNIGGQGQVILGAVGAAWLGFAWDLPAGLHLLVALVGGLVGGLLWGALIGWLKARTGAHEVITSIMLNYVALNLLNFLLSTRGFQRPPYGQAISEQVAGSARLPLLLGSPLRVHAGLLLALLAAVVVHWLFSRSRLGFRLRAVGANPEAARTAGMSVGRLQITAMALSGGLAGLAGASQVLGVSGSVTGSVAGSIGFDAITVALLGRNNPYGVIGAGLLFGGLRAGGVQMQSTTGVPVDLVGVLQALIVLFIAAPALVRAVFRLRAGGGGVGTELAGGWSR